MDLDSPSESYDHLKTFEKVWRRRVSAAKCFAVGSFRTEHVNFVSAGIFILEVS